MSYYLKFPIQFILLLFFQVLVLNNIPIEWWSQPSSFPVFTPYIYPLFLLLLPFETPIPLLILIALIGGGIVDAFMNTPGMHAFALVLIAYIRTNVFVALLPKNLKEYYGTYPSVKTMGWPTFLAYSFFLILIHHTVFIVIELWSFNMAYLLLKILASVLSTMLLIIAYLLLFSPRNSYRN